MSKSVFRLVADRFDRQVSGGLKDFGGLAKYFGDSDTFNAIWRAGRGFLDAAASSAGIPLAAMRESYVRRGFSPDAIEAAALEYFPDDFGAMDTDDQNKAIALVEGEAKGSGVKRDDLLMALLGVGALMMFSGRGRGRGRRGFRRGGFRRSFRRFSRRRGRR